MLIQMENCTNSALNAIFNLYQISSVHAACKLKIRFFHFVRLKIFFFPFIFSFSFSLSLSLRPFHQELTILTIKKKEII